MSVTAEGAAPSSTTDDSGALDVLRTDTPDPFEDRGKEAFPDFPLETFYQAGFSVCDMPSAEWLLKKLGAIDSEKKRVHAHYQDICGRLDADYERLRLRFEAELRAFAEAELANQKGKTLRTLYGNVSFRRVPGGLKVTNEEDAFAHARTAYERCIQHIEKLDRAAYRQVAEQCLTLNGELLPGVEVVSERESMSISFGSEGAAPSREGKPK